jgi:putative FmdB family regulatory protein
MPLYEYQCEACGKRFEVIRKFSDPPLETCTLCGKGPVQRLMSSPAIQFKGTGWYITDYSQKGKSESGSSTKSKSDDKGSDTNTESSKKESSSDAASSSSPAVKSPSADTKA